jgi:hypothetical protein
VTVETLVSRDRAPRRRRSGRRPAGAVVLLAALVVALAVERSTDQPPALLDVTSGRALLDGLGGPVPGAVAVSERVYRPCADDGCAEVVRVFATTGAPSFGTVVRELGDWASSQGLGGGGPWSCGGVPRAARSAAPIGDCSAGWLTPDGVAVDVHVRLAARTSGSAAWTTYVDQPVLAVWDHVVVSRPGTD